MLEGAPKRYLYVPVGMNALASPGVVFGGDERALRGIAVLAGLGFVLAAWRLARRITDEDSAAWVVGVLAGAHPIAKYSVDLLFYLPSTGCLLGALAVLLSDLARTDGLCAGAFYLR